MIEINTKFNRKSPFREKKLPVSTNIGRGEYTSYLGYTLYIVIVFHFP